MSSMTLDDTPSSRIGDRPVVDTPNGMLLDRFNSSARYDFAGDTCDGVDPLALQRIPEPSLPCANTVDAPEGPVSSNTDVGDSLLRPVDTIFCSD